MLCITTAGVISQIDNMVSGLLYDKETPLKKEWECVEKDDG